MRVAHLPREIRESRRAVVWRRETRGGRITKVPYQAWRPALRAAVDRPSTWSTFEAALAVVNAGRADGLGHVLGDGLVGIDLDDCRGSDGRLNAEAVAIVCALDSYTEVSPSGRGVHVLVRGALPPGRRRTGKIEIYAEGRYFTVTGWHLAGTPTMIEARTVELAELHRRIFPPEADRPRRVRGPVAAVDADDARLLARAHGARNGPKFERLWRGDVTGYPSASEADLALCNLLAYWTNDDASRIDRLFRASGLMRPKWDMRRGGVTWGEATIAKALGAKVARG